MYFNHESPLKKGQKNNLKINVIVNFVVKFYEKIPTTVHVFSTPHCPKLKMNDKKPSHLPFHFSGVQKVCLMLKKNTLTWTSE